VAKKIITGKGWQRKGFEVHTFCSGTV
jgi:hypothetical protein